jgi:glutathione S-transferase
LTPAPKAAEMPAMTQPKPKLTYFDAPASRGEECRLALHLSGVEFDDNRIPGSAWAALKPTTPFGSLPVLELPGKPALAQSNAILVLIGRNHDLHPRDPFEAARHEAMMAHVEDLRAHVAPTLSMSDPEEKKKARQALAEGYIPSWAGFAEKQLGDGPFFAGDKLHVVDLKLYIAVRWFASGTVDHVPSTVFAAFPKLIRVHDSVRGDERVKAWYAQKR